MALYNKKSFVPEPEGREDIYIVLDDLIDKGWIWTVHEVLQFDMLWNNEMPIAKIAKHFNKSEISILLLSIDRLLRGKIKARTGWKLW